jgi:urocanate hydratase
VLALQDLRGLLVVADVAAAISVEALLSTHVQAMVGWQGAGADIDYGKPSATRRDSAASIGRPRQHHLRCDLSVLHTNDPAMGLIRHIDAGYDIAERTADAHGVRIPMRKQVQ